MEYSYDARNVALRKMNQAPMQSCVLNPNINNYTLARAPALVFKRRRRKCKRQLFVVLK